MKKADIILIPFPFTNLSGQKLRPALVLFENKLDIIVAFISTTLLNLTKYDIILVANASNGLKRDSVLKLSKLVTLEKSMSIGKIGRIDSVDEINEKLAKMLDL